MGEKPITRQSRLDQVIAYYALSCAFTRGEAAELRMIRFVKDPRAIHTQHIATIDGVLASPIFAANALADAASAWHEALMAEHLAGVEVHGQMPLF